MSLYLRELWRLLQAVLFAVVSIGVFWLAAACVVAARGG